MNTFKSFLPITYFPTWYTDFLLDLSEELCDAAFNHELSVILKPLISFDSWKSCLKYYRIIYHFDYEDQVPGIIGKHLNSFGEDSLVQELLALNCSWSCIEMIIRELLCFQSSTMRALSLLFSFYYYKNESIAILRPFVENEAYRYNSFVLLSQLTDFDPPIWLRKLINELCVSYHLEELIHIDESDMFDFSLPMDSQESVTSFYGTEFGTFIQAYNYPLMRRVESPSFLVVLAQAIHLAMKHFHCRQEIIDQIRYEKQHINLRDILSIISGKAINNL